MTLPTPRTHRVRLAAAAIGAVLLGAVYAVWAAGAVSAWHTDPACVDGVFRVVYPNVPANTGVAHTPYGNITLGGSIPIPAGVDDVPVSFDNGEHGVEHRPTGCTPTTTTVAATTTTKETTTSTTSPPTSSATVSSSTTPPSLTPSTVTTEPTPSTDSSTPSTTTPSSVATSAPSLVSSLPTVPPGQQPGEMCTSGCLSTPVSSPPCGTQSPNATTDNTSPGAGCSSPSTKHSLPKTGSNEVGSSIAGTILLGLGAGCALIARRKHGAS